MKLAFCVNNVSGGWHPQLKEDWGGGEEVVVHACEAFAANGVDVTVFYNTLPDKDATLEHNGVHYRPHGDAEQMRGQFDWAICFKSPEAGHLGLAPRQAMWTDQERPFDAGPFELVAPCSDFLRRCLASLLPQAEPKLLVVPYGIPDHLFEGLESVPRDPNLVIHTGSPDRGLEQLLGFWPRVLEARPDTRLVITYGWDLHTKYGGSPALRHRIEGLLGQFRPENVEMRRFPPDELLTLYQNASIWAYFCSGGEYYGLSGCKAQVARCVPLTRKWGALHETVQNGLSARTEDEFVAAMIEALDPQRQAELREAIDVSHIRTWEQIVNIWMGIFSQPPREYPAEVSHLMMVPNTPPLGATAQDNVAEALGPGLAQWLGQVDSKRPWVSPDLGFNFSRQNETLGDVKEPKDADAVILGWELESSTDDGTTTLQNLTLPEGTPTAVMVSYGSWRSKERKRYLSRKCLMDLVGQQPNCDLRCVPMDNEGNGAWVAVFKYAAALLGKRDVARARARLAPRQTLSACFIVRDCEPLLLRALESVAPIADEIVLVDTGSVDGTPDLIRRFGGQPDMRLEVNDGPIRIVDIAEDFYHDTRIPVRLFTGTSPRYCFDCQVEHPIGAFMPGHHIAGFETPRNESIAPARGDWILWLDSDEELLEVQQLQKYLRQNSFEGYALSQHHFSADPPQALKVDLPVRLFRRHPDGEPHWTKINGWPTFVPGGEKTTRFTGIVHEHPGGPPNYTEGVNPVVVLSDVHAAHSGYYTERARRGRFTRNWPLMVADHAKYPDRVLGKFLWIRDLSHHMRYFIERNGGQPSQECVPFAMEVCRVWEQDFAERSDPFAADALSYVSVALGILNKGIEVIEHRSVFRKYEVTGDETVVIEFSGRVPSRECFDKMMKVRTGELERWEGKYSLAA